MSNALLEYRVRIRDRANTTDAIVLTTVRGDVAPNYPWIEEPPKGDGASFNPLTGESICASYTVRVVDASLTSTTRVFTQSMDDASTGFRPQLGYRVSFVEMRVNGGAWQVLCAGYLVLYRLVDALRWELTIQDATRVAGSLNAFGASSTTTIASLLDPSTGFPTRGCIFGGPLTSGSWLNIPPNFGGAWKMRVHRATVFGTFVYYLEFLGGSGAPDWAPTSDVDKVKDAVNNAVRGMRNVQTWGPIPSFTTAGDATKFASWIGTVFLVSPGKPNNSPVAYRPLSSYEAGVSIGTNNPPDMVVSGKPFAAIQGGFSIRDTYRGVFTIQDNQAALADGAIVYVQCITILPTEVSPIYLDKHPADFLASMWTAAQMPFYATAITNLKSALGTQEAVAARITAVQPVQDLLRGLVYEPYGVGVRVGTIGDAASNGLLVPFVTRDLPAALPAVTIADVDVDQDETKLVYELDVATGLAQITLTQKLFQTYTPVNENNQKQSAAPDGVTESDVTFLVLNTDPNAPPSGELAINAPGMLHSQGSVQPVTLDWLTPKAKTLFDRFGRGNPQLETLLLRGGAGDALNLGDEALVAIKQVRNQNVALGDSPSTPGRRMQLIRVDEDPRGKRVRFSDSGPNANQLATVPTVSIALSANQPRNWVDVTITNAATLNAASLGARVQVATTSGGVPASSDYHDVNGFAEGAIPTTSFRLGPFVAGLTVYVRARSEKATNPASNYGAAANVTLSTVNDPTGVTATPNPTDASLCTLTWTPGANTSLDLVDIFLRLAVDPFSRAAKVETLAPGSTRYVLQGLVSSTQYIASVQYRDPRTQDLSNAVDVTFTAGNTARVLAFPANPAPFAGIADSGGVPRRDGSFGIAVIAAEQPGLIEVQVAVETAVGSGVYGALVTQPSTVASVLGDWTRFTLQAPNDGLRRQLKARHVAEGCTPSVYTALVTVLPWTPLALPPLGSLPPVCEVVVQTSPFPTLQMRVRVTGVDPIGSTMQVEILSISGNSAIAGGSGIGVLVPNGSQWDLQLPTPTLGVGSALFKAVTADGRTAEASIAIPEATFFSATQGTVAVDANGNWQSTLDGSAVTQSWKYFASTSGFVSDGTVQASGTVASGRSPSISGGPLAFGQTIFISAVPYSGPSGTGTPMLSVHPRGAFLNTTATKFDTYTGSSFIPAPFATTTVQPDGSTGKLVGTAGVNPIRVQASTLVKISNGVQITSFSMYCMFTFGGGGTERLFSTLDRYAKSTEGLLNIAQAETDSSSGAAQLVTVSGLSHTVDSNNNSYAMACGMVDSSATASAIELWNVTIGYTQNNTTQNT